MQQLLSKRATGLVKWPPEYIAKYCRTCGAELSGGDLDWMGDHGISTPSCVKCEEMEGGGVALRQYCGWSGEDAQEVRQRMRAIIGSRKRYCILCGEHARSFAALLAGVAHAPMVARETLNNNFGAVVDILAHEKIAIVKDWNPAGLERVQSAKLAKQIPGLRFVFVAADVVDVPEKVFAIFPDKTAFGYTI